ncbi:MAG: CNNM domain-containing protein [Clostridiales bacterium]|jgi:hypothetical protein|nr:CNNM domain-containing protein [Clostridiales bacterium]
MRKAANPEIMDGIGMDSDMEKDKPATEITKKASKKNPKKRKGFVYTWTFKVVVISLFLTAAVSLLSEITISVSGAAVIVLIVLFIIAVGVFFDSISIAVTSCDAGPLTAMASRKVKAAKTALKLVNNAHKVSSFCADVVGDILGIISGACLAALAVKTTAAGADAERTLTIVFSSIAAAITIGGKSYMKGVAMRKSKEFVMFAARVLYFFERDEKRK